MPRFAALCYVTMLLALIAPGCRITQPASLPDAAPVTGLILSASPSELVIRPGSSGRIRFTLLEENSRPVPDHPVEFAIGSVSGDTAGAKLGTQRSLTDESGAAVLEVIVSALTGNDPAVFWVEATSPGANAASAPVTVTTSVYSVEIWPTPAIDLPALATALVKTRLAFFDNRACSEIDLHDIPRLAGSIRNQEVGLGSSWVIHGVAARGVHAVVGLGLDSAGVVRVGGCVDVPGAALLNDVTIRAPLVLDHLFPSLSGTYQVVSDFHFRSAPTALASILSAWQQWSLCPRDPSRLWLDCTIAALDADAKPCAPVAGSVGPLGERLLASRGTLSSPDSPCRAEFDSNGDPSLDFVVSTLFSDRRSQLDEIELASFPKELYHLIDQVRLSSRMAFAPANDPNAYWVTHELLGISFPDPDAVISVSFATSELGLPVTKAPGILATFEPDQATLKATLNAHGFTVRLGTTSRYAFEASSLAARNVRSIAELVEAIFALAQWNEASGPLLGCAALDVVACARVGEPRGCLLDACRLGLDVLAEELSGSFASLDGDGIDLSLKCSAPVIDLDTDGQADALGGAAPGYCWAVVGRADGNAMDAFWQGARLTSP